MLFASDKDIAMAISKHKCEELNLVGNWHILRYNWGRVVNQIGEY